VRLLQAHEMKKVPFFLVLFCSRCRKQFSVVEKAIFGWVGVNGPDPVWAYAW